MLPHLEQASVTAPPTAVYSTHPIGMAAQALESLIQLGSKAFFDIYLLLSVMTHASPKENLSSSMCRACWERVALSLRTPFYLQ